MKLSTIQKLAAEAIEDNDGNKARDLIDVLTANEEALSKSSLYKTTLDALKVVAGVDLVKRATLRDEVYNFAKFDSFKTPWKELWDREVYPTFADFFAGYILPTFHKVPNADIQHRVMACFALYNVAAVPNEGKKANAICTGFSRTGKSKFAERVMQLVPKRNTCTIKGNSSPKAITEKIHKTCYLSGDEYDLMVKPSVVRFDNIYWVDFFNRLDIHFVTLLALEKGDAICEIAGKEGGVYRTFSKYVFTTVEQPVRDTPRMDELLNRSFTFYFDRGQEPDIEPSLYDWSGLDAEYLAMWSKRKVEEEYFTTLSNVMRIGRSDTSMSLEKLEISRTMIAVGLYCDVFSSVEDALRCFERYWEWVTMKQENVGNLLYKLITNYLNQFYYNEVAYMRLKLKLTGGEVPDIRINFSHLKDHLSTISNGVVSINSSTTKAVEDIMAQHDLVIKQTTFGLEFVKRKYINNP